MSKPTVLLNMPSQSPDHQTGVGRFGVALATRLAQRGKFQYTLRIPNSIKPLPKSIIDTGIDIIYCDLIISYTTRVLFETIMGPIRFPPNKYDLILNIDPFGMGLGGRRRATIIHDLYFKSIPEQTPSKVILTSNIIFETILRGSHRVVAISKTTADDIKNYYPWVADRIMTIYSDSTLPIDPGAERQPSIIDHPYVLAVANAAPNKNLGVLAEAMVKLHQTHPHIGLVHVGGDDNQILAKALEAANAPVRLTRLTGINDAELTSLYQNALCLCVPSLYEGFCLPLVEAQKLGCPVVFSNRSAAAEVGGDGGLSFDPTDPEALWRLLKSLAEQPDLRDSLVINGAQNAKRFSWDLAAERYEALFAQMLSS